MIELFGHSPVTPITSIPWILPSDETQLASSANSWAASRRRRRNAQKNATVYAAKFDNRTTPNVEAIERGDDGGW